MPIGVMSSLSNGVGMSLAQAAAAIALCIAVVLVCRRFAVHVEREGFGAHAPFLFTRLPRARAS
jgi:hypothetical protein